MNINGGYYEGEIKDGVPHGTGTCKSYDGDTSYTGEMRGGDMNGVGQFLE